MTTADGDDAHHPRVRFRGALASADRAGGEGRVGTLWADKGSAVAWEESSEARRQRASAQRGVTFAERSEREIVFADLRHDGG